VEQFVYLILSVFVSLQVFKRTLLSAVDLSKFLVFSVSYYAGWSKKAEPRF